MANTDHRGGSASKVALSIVVVSIFSALPTIAVDLNPGDLPVLINARPSPGMVLLINPATGNQSVVALVVY